MVELDQGGDGPYSPRRIPEDLIAYTGSSLFTFGGTQQDCRRLAFLCPVGIARGGAVRFGRVLRLSRYHTNDVDVFSQFKSINFYLRGLLKSAWQTVLQGGLPDPRVRGPSGRWPVSGQLRNVGPLFIPTCGQSPNK